MDQQFTPEKLRRDTARSIGVALFVGGTFALASFLGSELLVASIGASAFIAFTFPRADSSRPRFLVGGYLCGCIWGSVSGLVRLEAFPQTGQLGIVLFCVAAVLLCSLSMSILDYEHPPAVALAIAITLSGRPLAMSGIAMVSIAALCLCKKILAGGRP